ncbi:MAG: hypothetical protein ACI82A_003028 [Candidatus Azotimanducaceae bacterium]|jgi:hypothetical protein
MTVLFGLFLSLVVGVFAFSLQWGRAPAKISPKNCSRQIDEDAEF